MGKKRVIGRTGKGRQVAASSRKGKPKTVTIRGKPKNLRLLIQKELKEMNEQTYLIPGDWAEDIRVPERDRDILRSVIEKLKDKSLGRITGADLINVRRIRKKIISQQR